MQSIGQLPKSATTLGVGAFKGATFLPGDVYASQDAAPNRTQVDPLLTAEDDCT